MLKDYNFAWSYVISFLTYLYYYEVESESKILC